jgi:putative spermidine/putrescine transport system substrate-binding protein
MTNRNRRVFARLSQLRARFAPPVAAVTALALTAGLAASSSANASANWATASSAQAGGGMAALVSAAEKEGQLNVITLPSNWANYGAIMAAFKAKYHIKISDAIPDGSSAQEIQAIESDKGRSSAPDVVDIGQSFAVTDAALFAPYKVATWSAIPAAEKSSSGHWYGDYGGYVSFGCDLKVVTTCPTTWAGLESASSNSVTLNGVPGNAGAATGAVWAAALNNGGSLANVQPGLTFFKNLQSKGIFNSTDCDSGAEIAAGQCPIMVNWDFLNVAGAWGLTGAAAKEWKVVVPHGKPFAESYYQAISKYAPDPAAARLWEEFLYSTQGQNLYLEGYARPAELATLVKDKTVNEAAYKKLPAVSGTAQYPTSSEAAAAGKAIAAGWSS